ncbi:putative tRNA-dihydrouridine synthase 3 [Trypanosoma cruzi]|nr:putative tRNA-dihydrouridine synthase 3 [Trypanosoma cruzi]
MSELSAGGIALPGVCRVKAEYLRPAPIRVTLDAEGRTRGMNKGMERQHSCFVEGTQRPQFEGESNFFYGETLQRIKAVVRQGNAAAKRSRDGGKQEKEISTPQATVDGAPLNEEDAAAANSIDGHADEIVLRKNEENERDATRNSDLARTKQSEENVRENAVRRRALFKNKLVLAPLTTVGNLPFRRVCKGYGADITVSSMSLVHNLNHLQKSEWSLLRRHESEDVFGLQIAVSQPQSAQTWAKAIEASGYSYDFIDINCGCPVQMIMSAGCGCGLWERRDNRLRDIVSSLVQHQSKPVSIKCRIGAGANSNASLHEKIGDYEGWGADAVTIHGRFRAQRYTKLANWEYIDSCAARTSLPVIGNGDIFSYEDIIDHRERYPHVSSYMIGRGALIKPWIFEEIKQEQPRDISSQERFEMLRSFCNYGLSHWGSDERGVLTTRRFLCEWLSFLCRYVPLGLLECPPQRINERPPHYEGRDELETLMASDNVNDWVRISEMLLGPAGEKFRFTPKHRSNSYTTTATTGEAEI